MSGHPYRTPAEMVASAARIEPRARWTKLGLAETLGFLIDLREGIDEGVLDQTQLRAVQRDLERGRDEVRVYNAMRRAMCAALLALSLGGAGGLLAYDKALWPFAAVAFVVAVAAALAGVWHEANTALLDSINDTIAAVQAKRLPMSERLDVLEKKMAEMPTVGVRVDTGPERPHDDAHGSDAAEPPDPAKKGRRS